MKGKWALFAGVTILGAIAAGALVYWKNVAQKPAPAPPPAQPALVIGAEVSLQGKVEAREVVGVQAPSDGTIEEYLVIQGEEVFEGQLLARIKNPSLEAEKERAKEIADNAQERVNVLESQLLAARLESARGRAEMARVQDDYSRAERVAQRETVLNREGATPRLKFEKAVKDHEAARLDYESANAKAKITEVRVAQLIKDIEAAKRSAEEKASALEEAESDLQATQVHAPVDGIILERKGDAGAEVVRGENGVFRIATDLGQLQVVIEPEPPVLAKLQAGMQAFVFLAEVGAEPLNAEISRIENAKVYVMFGSPDPSVRPGVTAQVRIKLP
ncbi:MAG: biotin/lipoyl-binding protein [Acidobacteria bacterium]|nr:biotin/lipoyl-binding protein [Acidobacteriota bacterium]